MNIFFLSRKPHYAARYHCDKHVVKMIVETAQIMCWAYYNEDGTFKTNLDELDPFPREKGFYRFNKAHFNHPATQWGRRDLANWWWLKRLLDELILEYTRRYGKIHSVQAISEWFHVNYPELPGYHMAPITLPALVLTNHEYLIPKKYTKTIQAVKAYRLYYINAKKFAKWQRITKTPKWYKKGV